VEGRAVTEPIVLRPSEASQAARVLTRAFADDEAWRTIFPADATRATVLPRLWRAVVGYSLRYGEVWTTPDGAGVACALGPGRSFVTPWREMRTGLRFSRLIAGLSRESRRSFLSATLVIDRLHRQAMPGPHEYLWALGVDTTRQGEGTGSALVSAFVARADEARLPAYLETETERNVSFYRRHGFDILREERALGGRLRVLAMSRPPRPL
jgi:ribosomal protein S18 acetylase RimI-like enzyme